MDPLKWTAGWLSAALLAGLIVCAPARGQVNPFGTREKGAPRDAVPGTIHMSDGTRFEGMVYLTSGRRLRLFDAKLQEYVDCSLSQLREMTINVKEAQIEKEWRFKEMGNDEKVYTGKSYARKDFDATLVYRDGTSRKLEIARGMPVYCIQKDGVRKTVLLQPFLRGEVGSTLDDLVHATRIVLEAKADDAGAPSGKPAKTQPGRAKPGEEPAPADSGGKQPEKNPGAPDVKKAED